MRWDQVYEWTNYRLACALMNARKSDVEQVLDPVDVQDGWFALELYEFQVVPGARLPRGVEAKVTNTISRLRLNDSQCREARREYAVDYWRGRIAWSYLERHAPFVARELDRQRARRVAGLRNTG